MGDAERRRRVRDTSRPLVREVGRVNYDREIATCLRNIERCEEELKLPHSEQTSAEWRSRLEANRRELKDWEEARVKHQ